MVDSLKTFSEQRLATWLDLTPAALYERQRQLVRLGLIDNPANKGRGAGVRATPANVAMLLLACMASDSLSEIATRSTRLARLRSLSGRCPLTQATNFGGALKAILSDPPVAARVFGITLLRPYVAHVVFDEHRVSFFGSSDNTHKRGMTVRADLSADFLQEVANDLHQKVEPNDKAISRRRRHRSTRRRRLPAPLSSRRQAVHEDIPRHHDRSAEGTAAALEVE
jgi:hypothetical protein